MLESTFNQSYQEYYRIIENAQILDRTKIKDQEHKDYIYYEEHHIIPRSLGGSNKKSNLVLLTPEEHFICHSLLPNFCEGKAKKKMTYAWNILNNTRNVNGLVIIGPEKYGELKRKFAVSVSGTNNWKAKKIYKLGPTNAKILEVFNGVSEAVEKYNGSNSNISTRARTTTSNTASDFCWAYEETLEKTIYNILNVKRYKIAYQLDHTTGQIIKKWDNATMAIQTLKIDCGGLSYVLNSTTNRLIKGSGWAYEETLMETQKNILKRPGSKIGTSSHKARKIYQIDPLNGVILKIWDSAIVVANYFEIKNSECFAKRARDGNGSIKKGSCWSYKETLEETQNIIEERVKKQS